jgi:DNA-binding response OmpR family regulator
MDAMRRPPPGRFVIGGRCPFIRSGPGALPSAAERSRVPRIVVQVASAPADSPVQSLLEAEGFDLVSCADGRALLEEVMHRTPDAIVYALGADCRQDLGVLRVMRRAVPDVPLVLLAAEDSLDTRKVTQPLRPTYYVVCPVDGAELGDVLRAAIRRRSRVL